MIILPWQGERSLLRREWRVDSRVPCLAAAVSAKEFELIQASCLKEEIDHSKPIHLNCYCDSYREIQGLKKNAVRANIQKT